MPQKLAPDDPRIAWYGAVSLEKTKQGLKPWRIFHAERGLYFPQLMERTQKSSGVRLAFFSNTTRVAGHIAGWHEPSNIDVCFGGNVRTIELAPKQTHFEANELPAGRKLIEIWFPPKAHTTLKALEIDAGAKLAKFVDRRPKWVTYGSSITQCSDARSPTRTWPAIVARHCGVNLTNLGFSGECVLDVMVARVMRDLPADYLSLCVGPNIYGYNALNERSFKPSILGFVQIVREKHPRTPLLLMSTVYYPMGETKKNAVGFTMRQMRAEVASAAEILRQHGDRNVWYVHGPDMLSKQHASYFADGAHPKPEGYELWGERFTRKVGSWFFKS